MTTAQIDALVQDVAAAPLPLAELGPGRPVAALHSRLAALSDEQLFRGATIRDRSLALACRSGLWLAFDFLDESHRISQELSSPEGSYWHGIMHRREPDYGNAKYWFHRVPRHTIHAALAERAQELFRAARESDPYAEFLEHARPWDASALVDLCQAIARGQSQAEPLARAVAQEEWRLLFAHCYAGAIS